MIGAILSFLVSNLDLFELIFDAITNKGVSKDEMMAQIKKQMVDASDALMKEELGG